jgi:DNA-binding transcriptional MerR regulator
MRIHEAAVTGLTIDAIRYYERQHLLDSGTSRGCRMGIAHLPQ